ncbi:MAG: lytic transglycosylase domain-containing protein, partial [Lentisphaerae bacterium]|nr:lytic transglycosylase domain-containing protein [Lentisphaerota bacterium]
QYLKYLRQEFGCWPLALAAYNAGEGRLKGIMNEFGVRTFEEVERFLPAETQAYVPRVMATIALRESR